LRPFKIARARLTVFSVLANADTVMTVTKAALSQTLFGRVGLNKREARDFVETFFERIGQALEQGRAVKLSGFGGFSLRDKTPRPGRNPRTGQAVDIEARRVVTFRASQKLKRRVQNHAPPASGR